METAVGTMRQGRDIVCFANDWEGDPLSKKHLMRRLSRGNRVLWVESLGNRAPTVSGRDLRRLYRKLERFSRGLVEVEPNLFVLTPLAIPAYGSSLCARINGAAVGATVRRAMRRLGYRRPLFYSFVPASAWALGQLGERRVVYHCVDEYAAFTGGGPAIAALEDKLLARSDLVITCSEPLRARKAEHNPNTLLIRHGVDHAHFSRALDPRTEVPADLARLPRPVLGFYGLIADWVDLALLRRLADAFPSSSLVMIGDLRTDPAPLRGAPNVHWLGSKSYASLPAYCRGFDVALLPFVVNELTEHANPLKLREYLAAGLPVVATAIPEARALAPSVRVAESGAGFVSAVGAALADRPGPTAERSRAVVRETWDEKAREIEAQLRLLDAGDPW